VEIRPQDLGPNQSEEWAGDQLPEQELAKAKLLGEEAIRLLVLIFSLLLLLLFLFDQVTDICLVFLDEVVEVN